MAITVRFYLHCQTWRKNHDCRSLL